MQTNRRHPEEAARELGRLLWRDSDKSQRSFLVVVVKTADENKSERDFWLYRVTRGTSQTVVRDAPWGKHQLGAAPTTMNGNRRLLTWG